jgi:LPS-assembly protein
VDTGIGPSMEVRGRLDEKTLAVNRAEVEATAALGPVTASASYFYLRQTRNDLTAGGPASVVHGAASVNLTENWRAFGSFAYDVAKSAVASNSFGLAFDNACVTFALAYAETRKNYTDLPDRRVNFRLELRTLGEASVGANLNAL